jgi:branched-chain amino acid transport system substrate-binding protein
MQFRNMHTVTLPCLFMVLSALLLVGDLPARAEEPIKIGAFFALSGPAASIGTPTKRVAQRVVDKINKDGGINQHPLERATGDT